MVSEATGITLTEALCNVIYEAIQDEDRDRLNILPGQVTLPSGLSGPIIVAQAYLPNWVREGQDRPDKDDEDDDGWDGEWIPSDACPDSLTAVISLIHILAEHLEDEQQAAALELSYMETILKYGNGEFDDEEGDFLIAPFGYKIAP